MDSSRGKKARGAFHIRPLSNQFTSQDLRQKTDQTLIPKPPKRSVSQIKTRVVAAQETTPDPEDLENEDKYDFKFYEQLRDDKKHSLLNEAHAVDKFSCACSVCLTSLQALQSEYLNRHVDFFDQGMDEKQGEVEKDFNFVIRRLQIGKNAQRTLRLFVPDTAILSGGEIRYVLTTGKDKTLKFVKPRERLSFQEFRKFLYERRRKREDYNFGGGDDSPHQPLSGVRTESGRVGKDERAKLTKVVAGLVKDNETINNREVALVKYKDDATQILTELEFSYFMQKRKVDKIWREIQYIQTFMRVKKGLENSVKVYFVYDREKDSPLFIRAKKEILIINGDIPKASEDFIPLGEEEHFEDTLRMSNEEQFCMYTIYKIVHYVEIISSVRLLKIAGEFVKDQGGFFWLINLYGVTHINCQINIREDLQTKNIDNIWQEENNRLSQELEARYRDLERKKAVAVINDTLKALYEAQKKKIGIENYAENYYSADITDDLFAKLHPDAPFKLSDLLKHKTRYDDIREFITKNAGRLQIERNTQGGGLVKKTPAQNTQELLASRAGKFKLPLASSGKHRNGSLNLTARSQTARPLNSGFLSSRTGARTRGTSPEGQQLAPTKPYQPYSQPHDSTRRPESSQNNTQGYFRTARYVNGKKLFVTDNRNDYTSENDDDQSRISHRHGFITLRNDNEINEPGSQTHRSNTQGNSRGLSTLGNSYAPANDLRISRDLSSRPHSKITNIITESASNRINTLKGNALSHILK